jgi:hypothetical protein
LFDAAPKPQEAPIHARSSEPVEVPGEVAPSGESTPSSEPTTVGVAEEPPSPAAPPETTAAEPEGEDGKTCPWCRAVLPPRENLNYCPFCGTDVNVVPCPSCGEALEPEWRFCIACGAEVLPD